MNYVEKEMMDELDAMTPLCHMKKMRLESADDLNGGETSWWECAVCGHTKEIK